MSSVNWDNQDGDDEAKEGEAKVPGKHLLEFAVAQIRNGCF